MPEQNRILARLSDVVRARITPFLERVELPLRLRLEIPNKAVEHVYFVDSGIVSVVATGPRRQMIEVGVIGMEGCSGQPHILGAGRSPLDTYVQVAGHGRRISVEHLNTCIESSPELHRLLLMNSYIFYMQVAYTALANGHASLNQRLSRWLLMAQDRLMSDEITLTHEFLAMMLGVRRPGVTVALADLNTLRLVTLRRGAVIINDREGLKKLADRYYGAPEAELDRLLG